MKRGVSFGVLFLLLILTSCFPEEPAGLSSLQETACKTAEEYGTCSTRLPEVGIVTEEECCRYLGACCI